MSLVKELASEIKRGRWWTPQTKVVVAVSTGIDSMVLLHLLESLRRYRPRIVVAHVNHELRAASRTEERYLRGYCRRHRLRLVVAHWPKAQHPRTGIENAARVFRYRFFKRVMIRTRASVLLTAHHLNDQAETILMRLIRGGDLNELTGIHQVRPFASGYLIRPLLPVAKKRIRRYARVHRIKYYRDSTNRSLKITRNRMRHRLLPLMARENPRILTHLGSYARQLERLIRDNRRLNRQKLRALRIGRAPWWKLRPLVHEPLILQWGLIRELFRQSSSPLITPATLNEILRLLNDSGKPQGVVNVTRRLNLVKSYRRFGLQTRHRRKVGGSELTLVLNRWYRLSHQLRYAVLSGVHPPRRATRFSLPRSAFPLRVRTSRPGDQLRLKSGGHQKVRRVWINQKVPNVRRRRSRVLITQGGRVLSLLGYKSTVLPPNRRGIQCFLVIRREEP